MDFFATVEKRRSVRKFTDQVVSDDIVEKALDAALRAPNSSNLQTWDFYWVKDPVKKKKLTEFCMNQSAARTANHLVVVTADPKKWRRAVGPIVNYLNEVKAPRPVFPYYEKLVPIVYRWGIFNLFAPIKWFLTALPALFRPLPRGPYTRRDLQTVATKSAALACQNLMLAFTALGCASCPMEGFDEVRVRKLLRLSHNAVITMVVGIGYQAKDATWGHQFRLPKSEVIHII